MQTLTIAARFVGPPGAANGGVAAGLLARHVPTTDAPGTARATGAIRVRIERPVPLDTPLVVATRDGRAELLRAGEVLAHATPAGLALDVPSRPGVAEAERASARSIGHDGHLYPECFVCGSARAPGDGLRLLAGPTDDGRVVAAPWAPDPSLAGDAGLVRPEHVWAALDCPGYFAARDDRVPMLLGQITARIDRLPRVGGSYVAIGWRLGSGGRKHETGTAILDGSGDVLAVAQAVWIEPR